LLTKITRIADFGVFPPDSANSPKRKRSRELADAGTLPRPHIPPTAVSRRNTALAGFSDHDSAHTPPPSYVPARVRWGLDPPRRGLPSYTPPTSRVSDCQVRFPQAACLQGWGKGGRRANRFTNYRALPACNVHTGLAPCSAFLTPISDKPNGGERLDDGVHRGRTCQTPFQRLKHPPPCLAKWSFPGAVHQDW